MYNKYTDDTPDDSSHLPSNILSHRTANINAINSAYLPTQRTADNTTIRFSYVAAIGFPNVASKLPAFWLAQRTTIITAVEPAQRTAIEMSNCPSIQTTFLSSFTSTE